MGVFSKGAECCPQTGEAPRVKPSCQGCGEANWAHTGAARSKCPKCVTLLLPLVPPSCPHPCFLLHLLSTHLGIVESLSCAPVPHPDPRPYLPFPLRSPDRFPLALLQGPFPEDCPERFDQGRCFFVHVRGHTSFLPCLPPWLPKQNIPSAWLRDHQLCFHQAAKNILITRELPENQRPPSPSQETPDMAL